MSSIIAIIITIIITLIIIIIYSKLLSWFYRLPLEGEKFFSFFPFFNCSSPNCQIIAKVHQDYEGGCCNLVHPSLFPTSYPAPATPSTAKFDG